MLGKKLIAVAVLMTACGMAGCGGSSSSDSSAAASSSSGSSPRLTKAQLIAKADPICAHYLTELHAHPLKKVSEFAQELQRLSSNQQAELSALRRLTPPSALAGDWAEIVAGDEALRRDMAQGLRDARAGDLRAVPALIASGSGKHAATLAIARRDGFKDCSRAR